MKDKKKGLTDPVVEAAGKDIDTEDKEFDSLDVSKIKVEVLPEDAAKPVHPFDGYPVKKIKIDMTETDKKTGKIVLVPKTFNITDWVLHNHLSDPVSQDPSNRNRKTFHSRSIMDIRGGNNVPNVTMQFSTPVHTANGTFMGALVPDPYIRCQLIFTKAKKGERILVDKRYMLLDPEQKGRLMRCYQILMKPQNDMEKAADMLMAGEEPESMREIEYGATEL